MKNPISPTVAYLAVNAHRWPIQTIVLITLLASTAYFSILEFTIPGYASSNDYAVSYYHHASGGKSNASWVETTLSEEHPDAVYFKGTKALYVGSSNDTKEELVLLPYDEFDEWLSSQKSNSNDAWILRSSFSWVAWLKWSVSRVVSLIKQTETFDIVVVALAYLGMHYTFFNLFLSMKRLGSNVFLATSVLVSSSIAFMFAYVTAYYLGVRIPLVNLSEGLPFLVITVGFDSKITLTRMALKATIKQHPSTAAHKAIHNILFNEGQVVLRDYAIEVIALAAAACSGVHGLWQFCFLATLILIYDFIMLVTFYVAILSIKTEMNKIKQNDAIRDALEEEGVSPDVAVKVANEDSSSSYKDENTKYKTKFNTGSIFKVAVLIGFLLNAFQLSQFPLTSITSIMHESNATNSSVSLNDFLQNETLSKYLNKQNIVVTILPTLIFEHARFSDRVEHSVNEFLASWTQIVGDPVLSKLIVIILAGSVALNGYLIKASKSSSLEVVEKVVEVEKKIPFLVERRSSESQSSSDDGDDGDDSGLQLVSKSETLAKRPYDELVAILKGGLAKELNDEEVIELVLKGSLPLYALEKQMQDTTRAVLIRRAAVSRLSDTDTLEHSELPYLHYDFDRVLGACCENVIGYIPLPIGVAGPLFIDGKSYYIPMATTEGCLVASAMRGCKALNAGGGVTTVLTQDSMTRGPCVSFDTAARAGACKLWIDSEEGQAIIKKAFESTSRFAKLKSIKTALAGRLLYIRFKTSTGDAMGMNMISKGVDFALNSMIENYGFEDMEVVSVSGNYCTDKKPAAINWLDGRGKSVVAECIVPAQIVKSVLKSEVDALIELNISKNLIGSAMAGSIGGFNAQAANLVTAIFLACGQDPAQNVESSNCITIMNKTAKGDLQISVSMPSIEVGTVGGGTILGPQAAVLDMLGVRGPHPTSPGDNARQLARIVASGVLAAELSLCSALAAGHLVQSHMKLNRSKAPTAAPSTVDLQRLNQGSQTCIRS